MRNVLIVGAGQSGLQLALGLRRAGYEVTVMTSRTPEEMANGQVMSTQCMFGRALGFEHSAGGDLWSGSVHRIDGLGVSVAGPEGPVPAIDWLGRLNQYAQSVDQRVKMPRWLELFESIGGRVVVSAVTSSDLDGLARLYDLVIVAAGKGDLVEMWQRDEQRSPFTAPQRALALSYVHGVAPREGQPPIEAVRLNLVPGLGELIVIPALTHSGPCDILFWEAIPGRALDVFEADKRDPQRVLDLILEMIRQYTPWEYERCRAAELTDAGGTLVGRYTPLVRHPVAETQNGGLILGMADVVVCVDPITGQGSNNASRFAHAYQQAITEHGDKPFDRAWMKTAFERAWTAVQTCKIWTDAMLQPPPPHVLDILGAAGAHQQIADRFANAFSEPDDFATWLLDPRLAAGYLADITVGRARSA